MARLIVGLIAVLTLISGAAYYLFQEDVSFCVSFTDAKKLSAGDRVYLSGQPVGKVVKIMPDKGKISVAVHIDREYRDQFTSKSSFFIEPDITTPGHMSLLVRNSTFNEGIRLKLTDKVDGIDSFLVWSSLEVADRVHGMVRSEKWQELLQKVDLIAQDLKRTIKQIDVDRLGAELSLDVESLSKNIDSALQLNGSKRGIYDVQNQIDNIQQKIKCLGDSEESRQLQEALNIFQKRLMKEIH
ncbi:MAG TPA: hypothetical protein DCG34_11055 [Clostridiales bacterium]|nr:hypothetical protein [Clostridiales bacterium]